MGNLLLGLHGNPPRAAEPTLSEVWGAIPPIREIGGARVWTANRFSAVDATFDSHGANNGAGTPCPAEVAAISTRHSRRLIGLFKWLASESLHMVQAPC
jgi:hypothetical protein